MPLALSKAELARIKRWTDSDREDPEVAKRREMVKMLDAASKEMTKNWPNSVENVNKRSEELRRARIEAAEKANKNFYKRYVKREQEKQQRLMYSARDFIFKNKDAPKLMLSAVIETCVQKERTEQIKFLKELRRMDAEQKKKDDDEVIRKAKEWEELVKQKARRRFEIDKQHQQEIVQQAKEKAEKDRIEYETEVNMQKIDNMQAAQQMAALKDFEHKMAAAEKARIFADMNLAREEAQQRRAEQKARDDMDDRLLQVLMNSRARVDRKRKETERNIKNEKLKVLELISSRLQSGDEAKYTKEQEMLDKARREAEAVDEARRLAQAERIERNKQARIEQRRQFLRDEEQRMHELNTTRQFDLINRFKNAELYEEYQERLRQEKAQKIKEFREDTLRLWKEREDREKRERDETRYFYGELALKKLRDADNKLFYHAAKLIEVAKQHGRPDYPLRKALQRYCKMYRLQPMPELPKSLREHFKSYSPWDGTLIDPEYKPPTPPPPAGSDIESDSGSVSSAARAETTQTAPQAPKPGTNGLNEPGPLPSRGAPREDCDDDFRRNGRANGLQRRNALVESSLPPLTVSQCTCKAK